MNRKMSMRRRISIRFLASLSLLCSKAWSSPASNQLFPEKGILSAPAPPSFQNPQTSVLAGDERRYAHGQLNDYLESLTGEADADHLYGRSDIFSLLPTQDEVLQAIDFSAVDAAGQVLHALNIPQYGNWTNDSWYLRFRGYIFTQPRVSNRTIERRLSRLLGFPAWTLREDQYLHAMQMVRGLFVVLKPKIQLSWHLRHEDEPATVPDGNEQVWPPVRNRVLAPDVTDFVGDYDFFTNISGMFDGYVIPGDLATNVQYVQLRSNATSNAGISMSYLVPGSGLTIVSDIDDVLRESTIYHPTQGFRNLLTRPFYPWMNMPDIYRNWSRSLPNAHFHYLTTAPDQMAQSYMDFIYKVYPHGSFDTRAVNLRRFRSSWSIRSGLLEKILQTYPERKFVLVGDNSNHDVMKNYPLLAQKYPDQVHCILVRNVSASDSSFRWPYTTEYFKPLKPDNYMIFRYPDDLANLDIEGGHCNNASVPQLYEFRWYGRQPWRLRSPQRS